MLSIEFMVIRDLKRSIRVIQRAIRVLKPFDYGFSFLGRSLAANRHRVQSPFPIIFRNMLCMFYIDGIYDAFLSCSKVVDGLIQPPNGWFAVQHLLHLCNTIVSISGSF